MPVTHIEWIAFAKGLVTGSEISDRSAASRAYYGAFHACKPLADTLPEPPPLPPAQPKGGVHEQMIRTMCECPVGAKTRDRDMAIRALGFVMRQCKSRRAKADYDIKVEFTKAEAEEAIGMAENALAKLQTIPSP